MPLGQPEPSTKPNPNQSSQAPSPNQPLELESINTEVGERLGFRQKNRLRNGIWAFIHPFRTHRMLTIGQSRISIESGQQSLVFRGPVRFGTAWAKDQ